MIRQEPQIFPPEVVDNLPILPENMVRKSITLGHIMPIVIKNGGQKEQITGVVTDIFYQAHISRGIGEFLVHVRKLGTNLKHVCVHEFLHPNPGSMCARFPPKIKNIHFYVKKSSLHPKV